MSNDPENEKTILTRRQALVTAVGGAAVVAAASTGATTPSPGVTRERGTMANRRMPAVYLPHGGGPWPFVEMDFGDRAEKALLTQYLQSVQSVPQERPTALVVISAHWEESVPTVMTGERPPLFFDYYGFPPESYRLTWPAPGSPRIASRVQEVLRSAGIPSATNDARGFDHGTFVPLKVTYPTPDIPTVQLSLKTGLDPEEHLAIGRALAPLRDEGIFLVGSGMSYHNMRGFFSNSGRDVAETFDAWLRETATADPATRSARLREWSRAPMARQAHPREEHLLPLMVIAGAAGADRGRVGYNGTFAGLRLSAYHFG